MYEVRVVKTMSGREIAVLGNDGRRSLGAASVSFIDWMARRVPAHQLSTEQNALVTWYEKRQAL